MKKEKRKNDWLINIRVFPRYNFVEEGWHLDVMIRPYSFNRTGPKDSSRIYPHRKSTVQDQSVLNKTFEDEPQSTRAVECMMMMLRRDVRHEIALEDRLKVVVIFIGKQTVVIAVSTHDGIRRHVSSRISAAREQAVVVVITHMVAHIMIRAEPFESAFAIRSISKLRLDPVRDPVRASAGRVIAKRVSDPLVEVIAGWLPQQEMALGKCSEGEQRQ